MKRCLLLLILSLIGLFIPGPVRGFGISTGHSRSLAFSSCIHSDDSTSRAWLLRRNFSVLAERIPAYNNEIDVSVTNFSVSELIKGIAISNGLSIAINFDKRKAITCNIQKIPVCDVLAFICNEKGIEATFSGDIVSLTDFVPPVPVSEVRFSRDPADSTVFSFDFSACTLDAVARRFNVVTGGNLLYPNSLADRQVSAFGTGMTLDEAVKTIAAVNVLSVRREEDSWYLFESGKERGAFSSAFFDEQEEASPQTGTIVYAMKHRTVEDVVNIIPSSLKQNMEITPFADLNGIVVSGDRKVASEILSFLSEIDVSVPLISIDVMIVDATTSSAQSLGLGLGTGSEKGKNSATFSPGLGLTLNADSINRLLASFSGLGSINLGQVSQFFYADLQILEESGRISLRSTPRLSTLNGHKAVLKSGEVKYYKESQVNIIGTQNPLQSESYLWKNVEANFVLDITPYMSRDSTITLTVNLSQDEFTDTGSKDNEYAPPGISKRSFTSIIRVKDGDMVLLGGIEKNLTDNSSRGLPYASRVPVLRSVFGKTKKNRTETKLNIFIKPTIL